MSGKQFRKDFESKRSPPVATTSSRTSVSYNFDMLHKGSAGQKIVANGKTNSRTKREQRTERADWLQHQRQLITKYEDLVRRTDCIYATMLCTPTRSFRLTTSPVPQLLYNHSPFCLCIAGRHDPCCLRCVMRENSIKGRRKESLLCGRFDLLANLSGTSANMIELQCCRDTRISPGPSKDDRDLGDDLWR